MTHQEFVEKKISKRIHELIAGDTKQEGKDEI